MFSKFITVEGVTLAYIEKNPEANRTLFFIHGNSSSSTIWYPQFESDQLSAYRLIAVDLPAHGNSPAGNDYSLPGIARILSLALLNLVPGSDYILAGLSLGTNIVAEMLVYDIHPAAVIIIGSCMLGAEYGMDKVFKPGIDIHAAFTDDTPEQELKNYWALAGASAGDEIKYNSFANDYYAVKDNFRSKMFSTVSAGNINDQVSVLEKKAVPALVIFGADELVCDENCLDNSAIQCWQNKIFKIPGAGHLVPLDKPEELNELIGNFAEDIFR